MGGAALRAAPLIPIAMDSNWLLALIELGLAAVASAGFYLLSRKGWVARRMGMSKAEARWMASALAVMWLRLIWTSNLGERLTGRKAAGVKRVPPATERCSGINSDPF